MQPICFLHSEERSLHLLLTLICSTLNAFRLTTLFVVLGHLKDVVEQFLSDKIRSGGIACSRYHQWHTYTEKLAAVHAKRRSFNESRQSQTFLW